MCLKIFLLPPGSQGGIRDVSEAYRNIGTHPSQWPGTVVRLSDTDFAIDPYVAFGETSGCGAYGVVADAGVDIFRAKGIGPLSKWVDDHCFLRILIAWLTEYNARRLELHNRIIAQGGQHQSGGRLWWKGESFPDGRYEEVDEDCAFRIEDLSNSSPRSSADSNFTYNFDDVDAVSSDLGIPWKHKKDIPFSSVFPFTGLLWNLDTRSITLPPEKREKYVSSIKEWLTNDVHVLSDVESLYGKLLHVCRVIPMGRAYLTNLEKFLAISHDRPFLPRRAPRGTEFNLNWWLSQLLSNPARPIPGPCAVFDLDAFSDASSGTGVAIVIGNRWRAWRLLPGWKSSERDIQWAEGVGFELLVRTIAMQGTYTNCFPTMLCRE